MINMNLEIFTDYIVIVVLGICLCMGYVIKISLDFIPNKYIPAIMLLLGTFINCMINWNSITASVVLGGMVSGLASTGLYETFRNVIEKGKGK